jgi:CelD/BcsL family acetyltransferase involved in cellulose biosynthesis
VTTPSTSPETPSSTAPGGAGEAGAGVLELRVVETAAGFDALQEAWSSLHEASGAGVFQSYEWQRAWWRHLGEQDRRRSLHLVTLSRAGRLVGVAPFQVERIPALGPLRLRRLSFLGTVLTDYLDLLVLPGFEADCHEALAAHLAALRGSIDVLSLGDLPDGSATREGLLAALRRHGLQGEAFVSERCPRTALQETWKATLDSFGGQHRRQLAKRCRQLQERFTVELEVCRRREDLDRDVEAFMAMHQHRWTSVGRRGVYADPPVAAFQREVARGFFDRGWLYLAFLRLDGARVAALCGFRHGGALAYYLNGVAEFGEARRFSPGLVQHCLCMEDLIGQGVRVYDFLRGTERYKYECGAVDVPNWTVQAFWGGARLPRLRNAVALLRESLGRRAEQERLAFAHERRTHGLLSRGLASYLWRRAAATLRDGLTKLRAPERSLTAAEPRP